MLLRRRVERYLKQTRMSPTRFGREVLNDPQFVADLRAGRELREATRRKVQAWLDRHGASR